MRSWARISAAATFAATVLAVSASQAQALRWAVIDPLSGGGAAAGVLTQKHYTLLVEKINAGGGINGQKIELVFMDNKNNVQDSQILLNKAIDDGIRYVSQGVSSAVSLALNESIRRHNERNPGQEVMLVLHAGLEPSTHNKQCLFTQFVLDQDSDAKTAVLTSEIARKPAIKRVYLINQDVPLGRSVQTAATELLKQKRPDIEVVGDELHPLLKVTDFSPYVAKIRASRAEAVLTANWGNDLSLLIKAARDADLKVDWFTIFGGTLGAPTAIGAAGLGHVKQVGAFHKNALPEMPPIVKEYGERYTAKSDEFYYWWLTVFFDMFKQAAAAAKSTDVVKISAALSGMSLATPTGTARIRPEDHYLTMPLFVSTFSDKVKFDVEGTGFGFVTDSKLEPAQFNSAPTCAVKKPG